MQPRIVIDFDAADDDDDGGADSLRAPARTLSAPAGAAAAQGDAAGPASGAGAKPADMLRSIQNMRLTLKRLEQQKALHAAGAPPALGGGAATDMLGKQATLQTQASWAGERGAREQPSLPPACIWSLAQPRTRASSSLAVPRADCHFLCTHFVLLRRICTSPCSADGAASPCHRAEEQPGGGLERGRVDACPGTCCDQEQ